MERRSVRPTALAWPTRSGRPAKAKAASAGEAEESALLGPAARWSCPWCQARAEAWSVCLFRLQTWKVPRAVVDDVTRELRAVVADTWPSDLPLRVLNTQRGGRLGRHGPTAAPSLVSIAVVKWCRGTVPTSQRTSRSKTRPWSFATGLCSPRCARGATEGWPQPKPRSDGRHMLVKAIAACGIAV